MTKATPSTLLCTLLAAGGLPAHAADSASLPTVTVSTQQVSRDRTAVASFTLDRKELQRYGESTAGDLLRKLPGVTFSGPPGQVKDIRVLGLDKGYTEILVDGQPLPSGTKDGQLQVDRIPADMIERIELLRLPSAEMPGKGVAGTVNIVLRKDSKDGGWWSAGIGGRAGELDQPRAALSQTFVGKDLTLTLAGSVARRDELKTKDKLTTVLKNGTLDKRDSEAENELAAVEDLTFAPRLQWRATPALTLSFEPWFNRSDERKSKALDKQTLANKATGAMKANGSKLEVEDKQRDITRLRLAAEGVLADGGSWYLRGSLSDNDEEKTKLAQEWDASNKKTKQDYEVSSVDNRDRSLRAGLRLSLGDHQPGAGFSLSNESMKLAKTKTDIAGKLTLDAKENMTQHKREQALWLEDSWAINADHSLRAGLRHERAEWDNSSGGSSFSANKPSLHYVWQISAATKLRAGMARAARAPKLDDLRSSVDGGTGSSGDPYKTGNATLRPEQSRNSDLGIEHKLGDDGLLGLNWSHRKISDMVEKQKLQEADGKYYERPRNVGRASVDAIIVDARYSFALPRAGKLTLNGAYSLLESSVNDSKTGATRRMNGQPDYNWTAGADLALHSGWSGGLSLTYLPGIAKSGDNGDENESKQKLLDVYIGKRISKALSLRLVGSNLLNTDKVKIKEGGNTLETERGQRSYWLTAQGNW